MAVVAKSDKVLASVVPAPPACLSELLVMDLIGRSAATHAAKALSFQNLTASFLPAIL